jgi:redox-sensing transcriptional repressor
VVRLPVYQRILAELVRNRVSTVSSEQLASLARVNAAKLRKDLSLLGSFGTRGSGYDPAWTRTGRWPWWASATWAGP